MPRSLDVIIPIYNEAENLRSLIQRLDRSLKAADIQAEFYCVDDHSTDTSVAILQKLAQKYPVHILQKQGSKGKAYSILEGAQVGTAPYIAMIDADLQYPPEVLPDMFKLTEQYGIVVARRQDFQAPWVRRIVSRGFQWVFGKLMYGLDCDIQSGLKIFKRDIVEHVQAKDVTPWTLDIPLLATALDLGYSIGQVDITFSKRSHGASKINLITSIREIGGRAISFRLRRRNPFRISPQDESSMVGAGLIHRGKHFITHTTLETRYSALHVVTAGQKIVLTALLISIMSALVVAPFSTAVILVGILSSIYFADVLFNLFVLLKSLHESPEIEIQEQELAQIKDSELPMYTILCPLYKEAHVLPQFLENISKLDWPQDKLDVILLLEADDQETVRAAEAMNLPPYVSIRVVPDSQPKTKPKACNYGLHFAKGEYLVIYDAEDAPDPQQLKKVYAAFQNSPAEVKCIQAKLNFYNPHQNLLTRFFTAEYSLWFDVVLTGLQSIQTTIPLGGTSNHFRTQELKALEGWDPFNVTEDCDLGIRLFQRGARTAIIDSVTLEEANSHWGNWLRQRSRWIKGYMQTYLVHMRQPLRFAREYGWHALLFQLVVGGKIAFMLINPFMWILTLTYFALHAWVGPAIEALYPSIVFYMAVTSLIFGNFMFIYYYMIGAAKRGHWTVIKWVFLVPVYWLLVSVAAGIALYELIRKPHYWQKTVHGLHVGKEKVEHQVKAATKTAVAQVLTQGIVQQKYPTKYFSGLQKVVPIFKETLNSLKNKRKLSTVVASLLDAKYRTGIYLVVASILAHVLNMATNIYLGARLSVHDFGQITTFMSLFYLVNIPFGAFTITINHQAGRLFGRYRPNPIGQFWQYWTVRATIFSILLTVIWLFFIPSVTTWLQLPLFMVIGFTPLITMGLVRSVNEGYLYGKLVFGWLALLTLLEPLIRFTSTVILGEMGLYSSLFITVPLSSGLIVLISFFVSNDTEPGIVEKKEFHLPFLFFVLSLLSSLATIAVFSLDNVLVASFLSPQEVGMYGLLGLIGKGVFFAGSLSASFILPLVSYNEGMTKKSSAVFERLFALTSFLSVMTYLALCVILPLTPLSLYSSKFQSIAPYLPLYGLGILGFTLSQAVVQYHLAKREYSFACISFLLAVFQVILLLLFHENLMQVVLVMLSIGAMSLVTLLLFHWNYDALKRPLSNLHDFLDLFEKLPKRFRHIKAQESHRILILNWRDTRHRWSGGAETYLHEMAKQLIQNGHQVTLFCGNDGRSPRNEVVEGVQIVRRGGFYTVYFWAFIYYIFKFRNIFDIVIDSANGIPFLTPLYVKQPIFLLIHHIHQEVFQKHLRFPFSEIAALIESDIMPMLYHRHGVLTVSESSKKAIIGLGLGNKDSIQVINPGIAQELFTPKSKTSYPSFVYIGRLKPYKNLPVAIRAFAEVLQVYPKAQLRIGGSGESWNELQELITQLGIEKNAELISHPSHAEKAQLFAESWVALQPSMIEGWGITVIEANASGTPVIAARVKGLQDSVQDEVTGVLVTPQDSKILASEMKKLIENPAKLKKMSKAALEWSTQFSWENSAEQLLKIFAQSTREESSAKSKKGIPALLKMFISR